MWTSFRLLLHRSFPLKNPVCRPPHLGASRPAVVERYSPNTYSTVALRCSLSSGVRMSLLWDAGLGPDAMARYCLPLTSKVIGGAEKPEPTSTFHTSSSVVSS